MKTTIVPAQVISVEDIIAANLNLTQVVLLISPIFMSALVFLGLPPFMHIRVYKIILLLILDYRKHRINLITLNLTINERACLNVANL